MASREREHWYELRSERDYGYFFLDGFSKKSHYGEAVYGAKAKQADLQLRGIDEKVILVRVSQTVTAIEL